MAWETPKTDWFGNTDSSGVYTGDYFNATDFNRIKNNLVFLHDFAVRMYEDFTINDVGNDKTTSDYFYADEINKLEENLATINEHTFSKPYGDRQTYYDNGTIIDFTELNRIEKATLDLYYMLKSKYNEHRTFIWNFGMTGGL